ncbi:hypothetical protein FHR21_003160 [Sphingopyxis panaciterrulae]|uniref:Uncharacterized protein n=1 Tax=Sphingopyxis panaciterrulae TaxID=462372 RepID=A0A7W9B7R7_9SPHN|nr:hypothetical protein [Sphingopyxis panaciterrulae]
MKLAFGEKLVPATIETGAENKCQRALVIIRRRC